MTGKNAQMIHPHPHRNDCYTGRRPLDRSAKKAESESDFLFSFLYEEDGHSS